MKRINLIPEEVKKVTLLKWLKSLYFGPGISRLLLLGISIFVIFNLYISYSLLHNKVAIALGKSKVSKMVEKMTEAQNAAAKIKIQMEQVVRESKYTQDKLDVLMEARTDKIAWAGILERLSKLLPENLWVNKVVMNDKTITIDGVTFDNEVVSKFMSELDKSGYFHQTGFNYTRKSELSGRAVIEFEVVTHLVLEKALR
jgi:Tfp pilus assembly protein PilN